MNKEVVIVAAVRTPIGSFGGSLKDLTAPQLGAIAIRGALEKAGVSPDKVDEVLMGCVLQANLGQSPARQAARGAGLPDQVVCTTVNKVCASGMKAVAQGAQAIALGDAGIIVAGGMESMSNVPFYVEQLRWGNKYGNTTLIDGLAKDGLTDAYDGKAMGNAAELCASTCGISREEQDAFAIASYQRAQAAWAAGWFDEEIVPVGIPQRKGGVVLFARDEEPFNVKFEKIPELKPSFHKGRDRNGRQRINAQRWGCRSCADEPRKGGTPGIRPLARSPAMPMPSRRPNGLPRHHPLPFRRPSTGPV